MLDALVIGAGPAGLMAAGVLAGQGVRVVVAEAMPTPARKFLMAGKSGLNLTKDEPREAFQAHYGGAAPGLRPPPGYLGEEERAASAEQMEARDDEDAEEHGFDHDQGDGAAANFEHLLERGLDPHRRDRDQKRPA